MKFAFVCAALLGFLAACGCKNDDAAAPDAAAQGIAVPQGAQLVSFEVPDMTCEGCSAHVQQTLASLDGVGECRVDLASKTATCVVYPDQFQQQTALAKLAEEGYTLSVKN